MLFYSTDITPRLQYISAFIGKQIAGDAFFLTSDSDTFKQYDGPKINYSNKKIAEGEFWILPHSLLFEKNIRTHPIECFDFHGRKAFFKTGGDIPFDIFAASFFLLSRYEEYLPHSKDIYGRYAHENSVAFKEGFLHIPLINYWLETFRKKLSEKFPSFQSQSSQFSFLPTYDIDEAFSYKYKSWWRTAGAVAKAMLKGQWSRISERRRVLKGELPDPFDSFAWMEKLHHKYKLEPRYFFLLAKKTGITHSPTAKEPTFIAFTSIPWQSWTAIAYLVIFGSLISFIAYLYALQHLPTEQASIYAYINPVVAVLLGAIIFGEKLTLFIAIGGAVALLGVYLVNKAFKTTPPPEQPEAEGV